MTGVEPTELVAGRWQLRPWPAADADLVEVMAERYGEARAAVERERRAAGWARGDVLGFAVREITTGAAVGEVVVDAALLQAPAGDAVTAWARPGVDPTVVEQPAAAVRRWAAAVLAPRDDG